jgi:predicted dehydrogenase
MNIIIFGLGSMGKRRARCLQTLGIQNIYGYDSNPERVKEALSHNIEATNDFALLPLSSAEAFFICTPPDQHENYMHYALQFKKPCFVEASVVLGRLESISKEAELNNIFIAPSCTLLFHPAIQVIQSLIQDRTYGKVSNFSYHCGQYLPDWHPWESVTDYYVSHPLTGGCREIVPFELTWITHCLGMPKQAFSCFGKTVDVGAKIDDTYAISLQFEDCLGTLLVDVTSRYGIRSLILNFEQAQLHWRWDEKVIKIFEASSQQWKEVRPPVIARHEVPPPVIARHEVPKQSSSCHTQVYNKNITEEMYVNEVKAFLKGITDKQAFPNNLYQDIKILKLLNALENEVHCENVS